MKRKPNTPITPLPGNGRGVVLVAAVLILSVLLLLAGAAVINSAINLKSGVKYRSGEQASRIAEAGIERTKTLLRGTQNDALLLGIDGVANTSDDVIPSFGAVVNFAQGTYSVVVTDNDDGDADPFHDSDGMINVASTGTAADGTRRVIRTVLLKPNPQTTNIRGSINARASFAVLGNMVIDGRDHDQNGNVTGPGKLGVSTTGSFDTGGNASVGGSTAADPQVNIAPVKSGYETIVEENALFTPPATPDAVFQLPEGTLKSMAQKGGGSQYVTNPSLLTFPLSGVTYVELPAGGVWDGSGMGGGSGILIIHNAATNAILKNASGGTFKGVVIADDLSHVHNTIIGAVTNLTASPADGSALGNGSGQILYSGAAISSALTLFSDTIQVISWKESI